MKPDVSTLPWSCWRWTAVLQRTSGPLSAYCSPACRRHRARLATRQRKSPKRRHQAGVDPSSHPCNHHRRRRRHGQRRQAPVGSAPAADDTERWCDGNRPWHHESLSTRGCDDASVRPPRRRIQTQKRGRRKSPSAAVAAQGRTVAAVCDISAHPTHIHTPRSLNRLYDTTQKAKLTLGKMRYSLDTSCCSTDLKGHPRSIIFMSSERATSY